MRKYIPYAIIIVLTVVFTLIYTSISKEKESLLKSRLELLNKVRELRFKYERLENEKNILKQERDMLELKIKDYESENDSIINSVKSAHIARDYAAVDSIGASILKRLRHR